MKLYTLLQNLLKLNKVSWCSFFNFNSIFKCSHFEFFLWRKEEAIMDFHVFNLIFLKKLKRRMRKVKKKKGFLG